MPDIPAAAVAAAEAARLRVFGDAPFMASMTSEEVTRLMLEAAAPAMAEHVAGKILAHMEEHEPTTRLIGGKAAEELRRQARRRNFRAAAQIAALAFMTDDDLKRAAAEALSRGGFIACHLDEAGNPVAGQREDGS